MSYFLKQTKINNRIYLQISTTTYSKETKRCSNKVYKKIGFIDELINKGIIDPISYYKNEVNILNTKYKEDKKQAKELIISSNNKLYYGHFLLELLMNSLSINTKLQDYFKSKSVSSNYFDIFKSLLFCRFMNSNFVSANYKDYFIKVYNLRLFDEKDINATVEFIGNNYADLVSIISSEIQKALKSENKVSYFNYNTNYITINMVSKPINECVVLNEKLIPTLLVLSNDSDIGAKQINAQLKKLDKNSKNVRVFDKAINYGKEIYTANLNKYSYIIPISLNNLSEIEQEWILDNENYIEIKDGSNKLLYKVKEISVEKQIYVSISDKNGFIIKENQKQVASFYEQLADKKRQEIYKLVDTSKSLFNMNASRQDYGKSIKYIKFVKQKDDSIKVVVNEEKIKEEIKHAGYKLIVTNDFTINKKDIFEISNTFWKIDDYFKRMRNQLDNISGNININLVNGHYLISFIIVSFYRIIESILSNGYSSIDIYNFVRSLKCLNVGNQNINLLNQSPLVDLIQEKFNVCINKQFFTEEDINFLFKARNKVISI